MIKKSINLMNLIDYNAKKNKINETYNESKIAKFK